MSRAVLTVENSTFYFKDNGGDFPLQVTTETIDLGIIAHSGQIGTPCWVHSAWPQPLPPAVWVWSSYYASPGRDIDERITLSFSAEPGIVQMVMQADDGIDVIYKGQKVGGHSGSWTTNPSAASFNYTGGNIQVIGINIANGRTNPQSNPGGLWFVASCNKCKLSLFTAKGNKLFEDQFAICDHELVYIGENCPPNTCECKHENTTCCIGANGEIVKIIK
jgi:hypothetical protein